MKQGILEEIEVLEESQEAQVHGQGERQQDAATMRILGAIDKVSAMIVDESGDQYQGEKSPVPPTVEEITRNEEEAILGLPGEDPIDQYDDGQENEEDWRVEEHQPAPHPNSCSEQWAAHTSLRCTRSRPSKS